MKKKKPDEPAASKPRRRRCQSTVAVNKDAVLTKFSRYVRQAYIAERIEWDRVRTGVRSVYRPAARYDGKPPVETDDGVVLEPGTESVWLRLAKFFLEHRIDPPAYIRIQFEEADNREYAPNPDQLVSPKSLYRWKKAVSNKEREIKLALESQIELASGNIIMLQAYADKTVEDASALTLLNIGLELSALFRYCLALSIGGKRFRQIARRFEVGACLQFERFREFYLRHWAKVLPAGFKERSRLINDFLLWSKHEEE